MIEVIKSITLTQIAWSIAVLIPVYLLFGYWIRKKIKDERIRKGEKEYMNEILGDYDVTEKYYNDDREVEYYKK